MGKTVPENRRVIRLLLTALLITTSATAGCYWGTYTSNNFAYQTDYMIAGLALVLCALLASAALDIVHSRIDDTFDMNALELERLTKKSNTEDIATKELQRALDEVTQENLRLMEQLSQKNHQVH